ncbi:hypothetical protein [Owenweeksia hongkongensis]|uniref:hypothetical protein n=1 Tax=Owenweeksia hongkongensis TaxID=253245 RepID=UPI003A9508DA
MENRIGTVRKYRDAASAVHNRLLVDDRSLSDIVAYICNYLEYVQYYDLENKPKGNFQQFVANDPLFFLVTVLNEPLGDIALWIKETDVTIDAQRKEIKERMQRLDAKIETWIATLKAQGFDEVFQKIGYGKEDFLDPIRGLIDGIDDEKIVKTDQVLHVCNAYYQVVLNIQQLIKEQLKKVLLHTNIHRPHAAMYIAFAVLLEKLQNQINGITERHLKFYYDKVLKQINTSGKPVRTSVCLEMLPTAKPFVLEEGTLFSAGKILGSPADVIFKTTHQVELNDLKLVELKSLLFAKNPHLNCGTSEELISSATIQKMMSGGKPIHPERNWYSFGANKETYRRATVKNEEVATLGFIIHSPVLHLEEGDRNICVTFYLHGNGQDKAAQLLQEISNKKGESISSVFTNLLVNGFKIQYSNAEGWIDIENYTARNPEMNVFSIGIRLNKMKPALQAQKGSFAPALRFELNENAPIFLYSFLHQVELTKINVKAEVSGLKNLAIYNNIGKMTPGKPFDLFGPIAAKGSYLMIGKPELSMKNIQELTVQLDWANIPKEYGGLETYYDGYPDGIMNDSFQINTEVLKDKSWIPLNYKQSLFETENVRTPEGYPSVKLKPQSKINFTGVPEFRYPQTEEKMGGEINYTINSKAGFYRFELTHPENGFGHNSYNRIVLDNATENAGKTNAWYSVNKPFIPQVANVSVSYTSEDDIVFDTSLFNKRGRNNAGTFIHITPFGTRMVAKGKEIRNQRVLANYKAEGYLFIGIAGVKRPLSVPIYFYLLHSISASLLKTEDLQWEYFYKDEWIPFTRDEIRVDETKGFLRSGIVELKINHVERDASVYWIRASVLHNVEHYPIVKGVFLNSVMLEEVSQDPRLMGKEVPAGSIVKVLGNYPQIKKVKQPASTFGGEEVSSEDEFYSRVSERIRTKNRVVSVKDFEDIALNNFDEVIAVRCVRPIAIGKKKGGEVIMVVIRKGWNLEERMYFTVGMLRYMENFLNSHASPLLKVKVVNPKVERLLVNCIVDFEPNGKAGYNYRRFNKAISDYLFSFSDIEHGVGGIGGKIDPLILGSYLSKLDYVEYIKELSIERIAVDDEGKFTVVVAKDKPIGTSVPWAILLPVKYHRIVIETTDKARTDRKIDVGLSELWVGQDMVLGAITEQQSEEETSQEKEDEHSNTGSGNTVIVIKDI